MRRTMTMPATAARSPAEPAGERTSLVLATSDLLRDGRGEVVLYNDSGLAELELITVSPLVDQGVAGPHRTLAGDAVEGFRFLRFEDGLTLYHDPAFTVTVRRRRG